MGRRILLFLATNIAVMLILSVVLFILERVFGIQASGMVYTAIVSVVFGFGGAFISLFLSKYLAKKAYNLVCITSENISALDEKERIVYDTVVRISENNGIKLPEIALYNDSDANAFATGATKNSSLVAVSTGLLEQMTKAEIEAVVAHEMAHILNGDMVTMTLLQGVLNTFVIFISRTLANIISNFVDERISYFVYIGVTLVLELLFGVLASIVVNSFSRHREFRADAGSAQYVGKEKMISALKALQRIHAPLHTDAKLGRAMIRGGEPTGYKKLFMTHPPLEKRIAYLENLMM